MGVDMRRGADNNRAGDKAPFITRNWSSVPCRLKADHDLGLPVFSCQLLHPGIQLTKFGCLFSNTNAFRPISFPRSLSALAQCLTLPMSISTSNVFLRLLFFSPLIIIKEELQSTGRSDR